jgi:hypothetical protein
MTGQLTCHRSNDRISESPKNGPPKEDFFAIRAPVGSEEKGRKKMGTADRRSRKLKIESSA